MIKHAINVSELWPYLGLINSLDQIRDIFVLWFVQWKFCHGQTFFNWYLYYGVKANPAPSHTGQFQSDWAIKHSNPDLWKVLLLRHIFIHILSNGSLQLLTRFDLKNIWITWNALSSLLLWLRLKILSCFVRSVALIDVVNVCALQMPHRLWDDQWADLTLA